MSATSSSQAFAAACSAMVRGVDAASTVHVLIADAVRLLGATTAGVLVRAEEGDLELLAAYSHRVDELEMHQVSIAAGPCFDAVMTGEHVVIAGAVAIGTRWPQFGSAMLAAGFHAVHAIPMRWRGRVLGAVNLFWTVPVVLSAEDAQVALAFADVCMLALMQDADGDDAARLAARLRAALRGRVVIEQAKGVLAQRDGLDMAGAFERLVQRAEDAGETLSMLAAQVVRSAYPPHEGHPDELC